jgi:hypothetical protein
MRVLLRPVTAKYLERLGEPNKGRIKAYTVETDLTDEEIAMIDEGMAEYQANPASFVPLESIS